MCFFFNLQIFKVLCHAVCDHSFPNRCQGTFLLFKYFLNDKEHSYSRQVLKNEFLVSGKVLIIVRKRLLCVRAKYDIC